MKIFLIGLSGVGKSSFGKKLANRFNLPFLDLDALIEEQHNRSIPEIFEKEGEDQFRKWEESALKSIQNEGFVLACGGGTPCFFKNLEYMQSQGVVIHLTLPLAVIAQRLTTSHTRPLLGNQDAKGLIPSLEVQWLHRKNYYEQADLNVDLMGWNSRKMDELLGAIEKVRLIRR